MLNKSMLARPCDLSDKLQGVQIRIRGIVQGVGFRPFVYRLANEYKLTGTIANNGEGVCIDVLGAPDELTSFIHDLEEKAPPISRITSLSVQSLAFQGTEKGFIILASDSDGLANTQIAPDIAVCPDCLAELTDPSDRRYRYPFTNCTNCGPRFTIVDAIPYDRPNTSMKVFPLCPSCSREYHDPLNRRFHAQPNACPVCGPTLSWLDAKGQQLATGNCLDEAVRALASGKIVAIKGLGGFHLAVDATSEQAIALLRTRKHRGAKPLAIMVKNAVIAETFSHISDKEKALLTSPEHPIVLLAKKDTGRLAVNLAPGIGILGIMLPYTPLHHLLLQHADAPIALVMTSGNLSDEPICTGNNDALVRLHGIADFFLLHDRAIVTRVDDSVVRVLGGKTRVMRRARGYAPVPIQLSQPNQNILACGAEMKNSCCLVRNQEAFISQHIGELTNPACFDFYQESIQHLQEVLEIDPPAVACDMHPDYLSSRYARAQTVPCVEVQHHHAHAAAVMAEHGLDEPVLAVLLDGTGYGPDGTVFGGEVYIADRRSYGRRGHLSHLQLPGGDRAAREPWRMALSLLHHSLQADDINWAVQRTGLSVIDPAERTLLNELMNKGINSPATSSCGRLFDGVAALLGLCLYSDYEGQAAMLLEHQASIALLDSGICDHVQKIDPCYRSTVRTGNTSYILDSRPVVQWILHDLEHGQSLPDIALSFHLWLIRSVVAILHILRQETEISTIVLSGGSMQNKLLLEGLEGVLHEKQFNVYSGELVPVNDGGISLGQAYIGGVQ